MNKLNFYPENNINEYFSKIFLNQVLIIYKFRIRYYLFPYFINNN